MNYIELEEDIQAGLKKFDRRILCASIITILATVLGFFYYDYSKQLSSADLIGNMIEGRARNNQKEALLMLAAANAQNSFEAVALYDQHGKRYFHLPADLNPEFFRQDGLWNSLLYITIERPFYFSEENPSEVAGKIVFVYSTLPTWIGIAFLLFISYFLFYRPGKVRLKAFILEKLKAVSEKVKVKDIAGQVRHDWKSVKQGILAVAETSEGLAIDERETLLLGINRMDGLLSDLPDDENVLDQNTSSTQKAPVYIHPGTDLDQVVREKRISSRLSHCKQIDLTIQSEAFGAYLRFSSIDFKRIVGNLLKNSLEAIDERACQDQKDFLGKIHVFLSLGTDCIVLKVQDNGIGITKEQLSLIGKNRFSTKTNGEGRGISSARKKSNVPGAHLQ